MEPQEARERDRKGERDKKRDEPELEEELRLRNRMRMDTVYEQCSIVQYSTVYTG